MGKIFFSVLSVLIFVGCFFVGGGIIKEALDVPDPGAKGAMIFISLIFFAGGISAIIKARKYYRN